MSNSLGMNSLMGPKAISWGTKVRDFERSFYDATCIDYVRFAKRNKFLEIGGFDETLTGPENWDFDRRIKEIGRVDIINALLYHNERAFSLKKYLKKKCYYSEFFDKYIKKWGRDDPVIKKQLGVWYRYIGVFMEDKKWRRLIRHPMSTLGMYILRLLVGLRYLILSTKVR